jgi:hypothetical protein
MIVNYTSNGIAHPDFDLEVRVLKLYTLGMESIITSTDNVIHATRVLVCDGKIKHDDIEFQLEGEFVGKPDIFGRLDNWPEGFGDFEEKILVRLFNGRKG